jgi:predicted HD phosphohydrolase
MTAQECVEFEKQAWFNEAVQLRRWDDEAKVVGRDGDHLAQFRDLLRAHLA